MIQIELSTKRESRTLAKDLGNKQVAKDYLPLTEDIKMKDEKTLKKTDKVTTGRLTFKD